MEIHHSKHHQTYVTKLNAGLENHPELAQKCSQHGHLSFYTTDNADTFEKQGSLFFGQKIEAKHTDLA
jgi:glutamate racemase